MEMIIKGASAEVSDARAAGKIRFGQLGGADGERQGGHLAVCHLGYGIHQHFR